MSESALDLAHGLAAAFRRIEQTTMAGVPILNPALDVRIVEGRTFGEEYFCVLITPWFMNLVALPLSRQDLHAPIGTKSLITLPGGRFEFIQADDDATGAYRMCSLFSPMFEFPDHEAAEATAREILALVAAEPEKNIDDDRDMVAIWEGRLPETPVASPEPAETRPALSRRRLFGLRERDEATP